MCITKIDFLDIITAIKDQHDNDLEKAKKTSDAFECDLSPYDSSRLVNQLFKLLHKQFPPENNFCSIQHFCFELDFGRLATPIKTTEQLWEELQN